MTNARSPMRALRAVLFAVVCVTLAAVGHASMSMSAHELPGGTLLAAFAGTAGLAWLAGGRRRGATSIGAGLLAVQGLLHLTFMGGAGGHASMGGAGGRPGHGMSRPGAVPPMSSGTTHHDMASHSMTAHDMTAHDVAAHGMTAHGGGMSGMAGGPGAALHGSGTSGFPGASGISGASGGGDSVLGAVAGLLGLSTGMVAVHLLAAAVCALWLARGEAAFFRLARTAAVLAFTPLRPLFTAVPVPAPDRPARPRSRTVPRLRGVVLAHSLSRRGPPRASVPRASTPGAVHV
ncbi:hypothetical protein NX801_11500 [Streptomyces sp. LP05-1]|uniref:Integral-membrane protein n=1 Tax=Streptomyces pyxinae TaxID=2970734 RepID=A0ABT2CI37_9ACTN|nr:hypothetical protein [Streptomyces sp. LP05-1]MCS0636274.1 hypothetical protein [Streptomyces sp. LP05-1]